MIQLAECSKNYLLLIHVFNKVMVMGEQSKYVKEYHITIDLLLLRPLYNKLDLRLPVSRISAHLVRV